VYYIRETIYDLLFVRVIVGGGVTCQPRRIIRLTYRNEKECGGKKEKLSSER
jgi:hypothetical protein